MPRDVLGMWYIISRTKAASLHAVALRRSRKCLLVGTYCLLQGRLVTSQHIAWDQVRTGVHGEVARALECLSALPLSGSLAQGGSKKFKRSSSAAGGFQNSNGIREMGMPSAKVDISPQPCRKPPPASGGVNRAGSNGVTSPRKRPVLSPQSVSFGTSAPPSDLATDSSDSVSDREHENGKEGSLSAVVFMDKGSARAHADAITFHIFKAFQRVWSSICSWPVVNFTMACVLLYHSVLLTWHPTANCPAVRSAPVDIS